MIVTSTWIKKVAILIQRALDLVRSGKSNFKMPLQDTLDSFVLVICENDLFWICHKRQSTFYHFVELCLVEW